MAKAKTQTPEVKEEEKVVETQTPETTVQETTAPEMKAEDGVPKDETTNSDDGEEQIQHDLSIVEVYKKAQRGAKFKRRGWSKQIGEVYVTVLRGETILSLVKGKNNVPFTPSQEDAVTADWYEITEEEEE